MATRRFTSVVTPRRQPDAPVKTYMDYYMPFVGVKYFTLFTDIDLALGRGKIGPVGWRRDGLPVNASTPEEGEILAPA